MKEKVDLSGVTETMLVPLYSRALEAERKNPQFIDETAVKVMDSLDYYFKKKFKDSTNKMNFWGCCARTVIIDDFAKDFIQKNPDCSVVNIGCGLDDRFSRVDNGRIVWYNIDLPEVMDLREKLIEKNDRIVNISVSVFDYSWMELVENKENLLVIAEGVLMYLEKEDVSQLFSKISDEFGNVELVLELMAEWMVENQKVHDTVRSTGAVFKWGVKESRDFESSIPDYKLIEDMNLTEGMKRYSPLFLTLVSPFLKPRNNRIARFKKR
ncbi:MAG: class I SAM-dependent methyltransferase [Methanobrevibacter sp.]|nr:class I SAM-dependent methyltransferase [Methanobrevibacter sp.]